MSWLGSQGGGRGEVLLNTFWEFWCVIAPKVCNIFVSTKIKLLNLKEFGFSCYRTAPFQVDRQNALQNW